jgi:two-component system, LytTR family, sensor kinase
MVKHKKEILLHILFWMIYVLNEAATYPSEYIDKMGFWNIVFKEFAVILVYIVFFYVNYLYLIPRYFSKKKYLRFLGFLLILEIITIILFIIDAYFLDWLYDTNNYFVQDRISCLVYLIFQTFFYLVVSTGARFTRDWFQTQKLKEELQQYKVSAELALLKYQLNPHFLFNSLNNIYSLIISKSDKLEESILKLSDLMRYILKNTEDEMVPLSEEIKFLQSFTDLQKLRLSKPSIVDFSVTGNSNKLLIRPMILIPFIENTFKHGDLVTENAKISIGIDILNKTINLNVSNRIAESNQTKDSISGIGIPNVRRRLEILYSGRYSLNINSQNGYFKVELSLVLE